MSKDQQKSTGKAKQDSKKPAQQVPHELQDGLAESVQTSLASAGGGTIESQATFLQKLDLSKRQDTMTQIGRLQGNLHVQRLVQHMNQVDQEAGDKRSGVSDIQRQDQHDGATIPTADEQRRIRDELNPTVVAPRGGPAPEWDGKAELDGSISATAQANRAALQMEMTVALIVHLLSVQAGIDRVRAAPKLPMTAFVGAGQAAKQAVDAMFSSYGNAAALTAPQQHVRSSHQFRASGPDQNLFDATDESQRRAAGQGIAVLDLANWMAESDEHSRAAMRRHHFNPTPRSPEEDFLYDHILDPFVAGNRAALHDYDLYMFGMADPETGMIVAPPQLRQDLPSTPAAAGEPTISERATKWDMFKLLIHEYMHTLQHPVSRTAGQENRIITEGFCEMFTQMVMPPGPVGHAGLAPIIEGGTYTAHADVRGDYSTPEDYVEYLEHANNIRGIVGDNAVKAAFFQGHVEYLGVNPDGSPATPSSGSPGFVDMPPGITTLDQLAAATGVSAADLIRANFHTINATDPLPRTDVFVPGCREHLVVVATDRAGNQQPETKAQIATQNGVSAADLERANPGVDWNNLTQGQKILIPPH